MTTAEAIELIRPAMPLLPRGTWADFGAGRGTFTEGLASLLGRNGRVIAIERDPNVLNDLRRLAARSRAAQIQVAAGDIQHLADIPALKENLLAGAVFGNVLHYVAEPEHVLVSLRGLLEPEAPIIVIEYDRRGASRWIPYPLPFRELVRAAASAGLGDPVEIGRRDSRFQGELYCAVMHA